MKKKPKRISIQELDVKVREWAKTQNPPLTEMEIKGVIFQTAIFCDNVYIPRKKTK